MSIRIRNIAETDLDLLLSLMREFAEYENLSEYCTATQDRLRVAMFGDGAFVEGLIAFAENTAIGYALAYPCFSSFRGQRGLYLEDIYIRPDHRRKNLGEKLLREIARRAKGRGFERIDFLVLDWNTPTINFYKKLGAVFDEDERHFKLTGKAFTDLAA